MNYFHFIFNAIGILNIGAGTPKSVYSKCFFFRNEWFCCWSWCWCCCCCSDCFCYFRLISSSSSCVSECTLCIVLYYVFCFVHLLFPSNSTHVIPIQIGILAYLSPWSSYPLTNVVPFIQTAKIAFAHQQKPQHHKKRNAVNKTRVLETKSIVCCSSWFWWNYVEKNDIVHIHPSISLNWFISIL